MAAYRYFRAHGHFSPSAHTSDLRRTAPKFGRNDLCPCGSGKKYKRCCGGATVN
ncbi:MAG: SEC-C metal-binding domain-containing protein [Candidatus Sulfotelmatobacter sp.]